MKNKIKKFARNFTKTGIIFLLAFMVFASPLTAGRKKEGTQTQNKQTKSYRYLCKICGANIVSYNKETIDNHKKLCREKNKKNNASKKKSSGSKKKK